MGVTSPQPEGPTVGQVAIVLASASTPSVMVAVLGSIFGGFGISVPVTTAALYMVLKGSPPVPMAPGPAMAVILRAQSAYQAAYLVNAAARMQNAVNTGTSLDDAIAAEMRNLVMHADAQTNRRQSAAAVDDVAGGDPHRLLIWDAVMDDRTSAECRAADGNTFTAADPPSIGYPGMVHPHCRCKAKRAPLGAHHSPVDRVLTPELIAAH